MNVAKCLKRGLRTAKRKRDHILLGQTLRKIVTGWASKQDWRGGVCPLVCMLREALQLYLSVAFSCHLMNAYFRSCYKNTTMPLANKREIGKISGFPCVPLKDLTCMLCYKQDSVYLKKLFSL